MAAGSSPSNACREQLLLSQAQCNTELYVRQIINIKLCMYCSYTANIYINEKVKDHIMIEAQREAYKQSC